MATETTLIDAPAQAGGAGLYLVVLSAAGAVTFPVSRGKPVVIGRSRRADIQLDDPLASREHARLEPGEGEGLIVVDLESANGTRFKGQSIAPRARVSLAPGESIEIGNSVLVLQRHLAGSKHGRIWSHHYFEAKLAEACRRAAVEGGSLAVLRVRFEASLESGRVLPILLDECGAGLLANYGPREYEVLVAGDGSDAEALRERLAARLFRLGEGTQFGLSRFRRDGQSVDALLGRASPRTASAAAMGVVEPIAESTSAAMARTLDLARQIARSNINVLILGETGVGKEVMAASIRGWSPRGDGPMVCINCAGLSESLLESELFGHEKGSFTGAVQKVGLLESAQGGTVLLDEIGELPLGLQAKLLRVLQDRRVRRVGGVKEIPLDVRFVAATNRNLELEAERGSFRQDLYFRINGATVLIPPLRERREEIEALSRRFIEAASRELGRERAPLLSRAAVQALLGYAWPGNIRELKNVLERAVLLCSGDTIDMQHLPAEKLRGSRSTTPPPLSGEDTPAKGLSPTQASERQRIIDALAQCAGNQTSAASLLGMPRRTLVSKLAVYDIPRPRGGRAAGA